MRQLQVAFNRQKLAEFIVVDSEVLDALRGVHSRIPQAGPAPSGPHALVASLLGHCVNLAEEGSPVSPEFRSLLARHIAYHRPIIAMHSSTDLGNAANGFQVSKPRKASADAVRQCVGELLAHLSAGFDVEVDLVGTPDLTETDAANPLFQLIPRSVFTLRTEASVNLIAPWFMRSLEVPGDVCEIGCFRGTMSVKFAFALKALGIDKTVYAFDTFEGFTTDDPDGGQVGVGFYRHGEEDGFEELTRWSKAVPVRPIKGDATQTCKVLKDPLAFVWMDLDHGSLMRPVFETIWPLLSDRTILGVDDVRRIDGAGRPVTPGVEPWLDELVAARRVTELARYPGDFIRFYKVNK
jgi:hypothetical protein